MTRARLLIVGLFSASLWLGSMRLAAQDAPRVAVDAGRVDAGARDAAVADAGQIDAGSVDVGQVDAARVDAGPAGADAGAIAAPTEPTPEPDAPLPEGHEPELELRVTPEEGLMTGDLVHVVITARVPEGDDVAVPRQTFGPFELFDQDHSDRPIDGGRREFVFEVDLLALEPGEHELPALRIRVVTEAGAVGVALTEPRTIVVGSLVANEPDAQPRPPTEPVPVMQDDYTLAWVLGILGALLLTALLTWLFARWWGRRPKVLPPPPPPRPAWELALEKLEELRREQGELLAEGHHVDFVDGVSDALREYFGSRYGFNGLESTTDEVIARLRDVRLQGISLPEITALLGDCDLVKFAKAVPDEGECDRMIASAIRIVRDTTPRPGVIGEVARPSGYTAAEVRVAEAGAKAKQAAQDAAPSEDAPADAETSSEDAAADAETSSAQRAAAEAAPEQIEQPASTEQTSSGSPPIPITNPPPAPTQPKTVPVETLGSAQESGADETGSADASPNVHPTLGGNPFDPEDRS